MARLSALTLLIAAALALSACNRNPLEVTRSNCPALGIMGKANTKTIFAGEEQTTENVAFNAIITRSRLSCVETEDVNTEFSFDIIAWRGPAANADSLVLPYFVVVLKDNRQIITKRMYEATVNFAPGEERAGVHESLSQFLPDIEQARRYDYEILIGFQLAPEDVVYNALR